MNHLLVVNIVETVQQHLMNVEFGVKKGKGVARLKIDAGSVTDFHSSLSIFNDLTTLLTSTLLFLLSIFIQTNTKYVVLLRNNLAKY